MKEQCETEMLHMTKLHTFRENLHLWLCENLGSDWHNKMKVYKKAQSKCQVVFADVLSRSREFVEPSPRYPNPVGRAKAGTRCVLRELLLTVVDRHTSERRNKQPSLASFSLSHIPWPVSSDMPRHKTTNKLAGIILCGAGSTVNNTHVYWTLNVVSL